MNTVAMGVMMRTMIKLVLEDIPRRDSHWDRMENGKVMRCQKSNPPRRPAWLEI